LLIFDLDETLIHCEREELLTESNESETDDQFKFKPEIYIDIKTPDSDEVVKTGFTIRPYALECLKAANQFFEVAIFTAGFDWYANPIIDYLDPTGELIQHRYFRQHATYLEEEGFFVKDLRIFKGIDLKDILIIDNYVHSFAFHLENGIPIVPFLGEKDD
jgi:CTD small phosphatase-like protein 2